MPFILLHNTALLQTFILVLSLGCHLGLLWTTMKFVTTSASCPTFTPALRQTGTTINTRNTWCIMFKWDSLNIRPVARECESTPSWSQSVQNGPQFWTYFEKKKVHLWPKNKYESPLSPKKYAKKVHFFPKEHAKKSTISQRAR